MDGSPTRNGLVSLLLVSHSAAIADGLAEFVAQVAGPDVAIVAAGGGPEGTLGTDGDKVVDGLRSLSGGAGAVVLMDNTWATPLFFPAHEHGVDMSIEAGTKYLSGGSDLLLGLVSANQRCWRNLRQTFDALAAPAGPEDVFLALRGLRTLQLRLKEHERQALAMAHWLGERAADRARAPVLHPHRRRPDDVRARARVPAPHRPRPRGRRRDRGPRRRGLHSPLR